MPELDEVILTRPVPIPFPPPITLGVDERNAVLDEPAKEAEPVEAKEYYEVTVIRGCTHWETQKVRVLAVSRDDAYSEVENLIYETDFWSGADESEGDFDDWEFDDCRLLKVSEANE